MPVSVGLSLRREHLIAACLTGAVVVIVGYASGLGLKPGVTSTSAPSVIAGGSPPVGPGTQQSLPSDIPPVSTVPPMPPMGGMPNTVPVASMPGGVGGVIAQTQPPADSTSPGSGNPTPTGPPTTSTPPPPPPGTPLPQCQPGLVQPVLDGVSGLPLVGGLATGLGVTGPNGLLATILGYCQAADGTAQLAMVPAPSAAPTTPSALPLPVNGG
ncbi:MAG: hypothetical protein JWQ81_3417 [Amycolatopsis sp.]|uniref:hypothetical protein n=1 Tax=Amycolatopsis sp. TaxID=37632 RepID=UPI00260804F2|nr:hypothetical protein [Amycolatopsis sp.]MCU1682678.1 hypothetical protein [Amycolatopsis sp.]